MRVLVCGGRDFDDWPLVNRVLSYLPRPSVIVHGGCRGADMLADRWAKGCGIKTEEYEVSRSQWRRVGNGAGPLRNQRMIDEGKPDLVIAFPGNRGTADLIRRAKAAGIPVKEIS